MIVCIELNVQYNFFYTTTLLNGGIVVRVIIGILVMKNRQT